VASQEGLSSRQIIIQLVKETGYERADWILLALYGDFCRARHGNEPSIPINVRELPDWLSESLLFKEGSPSWS
jgi:hypothetical protein